MCPKKVTNFVVGLCERCVVIWTNKRCMENMNITIEHVKAAIVSMSQNNTFYLSMEDTFRRVIEEEQRRRRNKVELFQKIREKFQTEILIQEKLTYAYFVPYQTEERYFDIDIHRMHLREVLEDTRLQFVTEI
ncbi:hypothetical protein ACLKA6_012416 [Drosophila palustris]